MNHPQITVRFNTAVQRFLGRKHLEGVVVRTPNGEETLRPAAAFVFIGLKPNTDFLRDLMALTKEGFMDAPEFATSMSGVFAAGDARAGSTKQVASAVGEGAAAALAVRHYLEGIGEARHVETEMMAAG